MSELHDMFQRVMHDWEQDMAAKRAAATPRAGHTTTLYTLVTTSLLVGPFSSLVVARVYVLVVLIH